MINLYIWSHKCQRENTIATESIENCFNYSIEAIWKMSIVLYDCTACTTENGYVHKSEHTLHIMLNLTKFMPLCDNDECTKYGTPFAVMFISWKWISILHNTQIHTSNFISSAFSAQNIYIFYTLDAHSSWRVNDERTAMYYNNERKKTTHRAMERFWRDWKIEFN